MNTATPTRSSSAVDPAQSSAASSQTKAEYTQYVSFWLDQQLFGVPVATVQEVLNPQAIARTPLARPEVAGLLNLRGQIVTAVNLRKRLDLTDEIQPEHSMNVVLRHEEESYSLLVDKVGDVITVPNSAMTNVPPTLTEKWRHVTEGVFQLEHRLLIILDVAAVLNMKHEG